MKALFFRCHRDRSLVKKKGATEGEMIVWHHQFSGFEFEQTLEDSEGQGSLACCSPRGHKESDIATQQLIQIKSH